MDALSNQHAQLHDYLNQIKGFSTKEGLPRITYVLIGEKIGVSSSSISQFIRLKTKKPRKIFSQFQERYAVELARWPEGERTIGRALVKADVEHFLNPRARADARPAAAPARVERAPVHLPASIVIAYRGHESDKDGAGMVYDHMTIQTLTGFPTKISMTSRVEERAAALNFFREAMRTHTAPLPFDGKEIPAVIDDSANGGLLLVPGRARKIENEPIRKENEEQILRKALNRGQPILGICAGAWRVWEQAFSWSNYDRGLDTSNCLTPVKDHSNSRMLCLDKTGTRATYNVQVHQIEVEEDSLLKSAMKANADERISVNSVHWKAVNEDQKPFRFKVSARAKQDPRIKRKNRHGDLMGPEENSVEAFENEYGAPCIGVQWHPEGYSPEDSTKPTPEYHVNLLRYMAIAGDAYKKKRAMLQEFIATRPDFQEER